MIAGRIEALRQQMRNHQLNAVIIYGTDPHQSEYVNPRWRSREWITGFTGSAGTVVVTEHEAGLWTDSRYHIQASEQLQHSGVALFKSGLSGVQDYPEWLNTVLEEGAVVGVFGDEISFSQYRDLMKKMTVGGIKVQVTDDLLEPIWSDRPQVPKEPITGLPLELTGKSREAKIEEVRRIARDKGAESVLITSLDDIAWMMNLRGSDVEYNPLFLSYLLMTPDDVYLFGNEGELSSVEGLSDAVTIYPYESIEKELPMLLSGLGSIYLSPDRVNMKLYSCLDLSMKVITDRDISTDLKSMKNTTEIEGMLEAHRYDGAALVSFLHWLETGLDGDDPMNEISIAEKLLEFRKAQRPFLTESFSPIAGFRDHGALAHYSATAESAYEISGDGLMVLDSGGQYQGGTTDVTRTLLFGNPTEQQVKDYTMVLKGHLALGRQQFPEGTCGYQLDTIARMWMWNEGRNFGHGTGHGVGHMLNVHEGPQNISPKPITIPLRPGMVVSNEPGIYREGSHGIRIENLVYVAEAGDSDFGPFLKLENLTFCIYEKRLIDKSLLSDEDIRQIDAYHQEVYEQLKELLPQEVAEWLKQKAQPL